MTPHQVFAVAAIGGLCTAIALLLVVGLAIGVYNLSVHIADLRDQRRAEREDLHTCRAIDALGTTNHPKE